MAQFRSVPPKLSLPPHPSLSNYANNKTPRIYPTYSATPTQSSYNTFLFSPSPTPTPSKRPRAPQGPLWILVLLQLFSLYALYQWRSSYSHSSHLGTIAFLSLLFASLSLCTLYRPWNGRPVSPSQWGLLSGNAAILALSYLLLFTGLQQCGPLEAILADFSGFLLSKVLLDHFRRSSVTVRKGYGIIAVLMGIFLFCHGWARPGCSPVAVDITYKTQVRIISQPEDCVKVWQILMPLGAGSLSAFRRTMIGMTSLRSVGKKRTQVISYAMGAMLLFPLALFEGVFLVQQSLLNNASISLIVGFGMVVAFFCEFYCEEKLLIPMHSFRTFQIISCCICVLDLLYGLGISLVGFTFCSIVLGIGIRELAGQHAQLEIGDTDEGSFMFTSDIRRPIQHIISDKKSRKIAIFLLINTGFMVVEFFYGFLRNSLGLISDACHMLFDCAALAIGLYASYISRLPENSKFNYGYGRFEVVSGYANAVLLVLVASLIVLESIERILEPPEISTESLLVVSVGGLLVNIVGLVFFHEEHHHAHQGTGHSCSHSHSSHGRHSGSAKEEHSTITFDDCHDHVHKRHHDGVHQHTSSYGPSGHSEKFRQYHGCGHNEKFQNHDHQDHNMGVNHNRGLIHDHQDHNMDAKHNGGLVLDYQYSFTDQAHHHDHDFKSDFNHDIKRDSSLHHHHHGEEHSYHQHEHDHSSILAHVNEHSVFQDNHQHDHNHKHTGNHNGDLVHGHQHHCHHQCDHIHAHSAGHSRDIVHDHRHHQQHDQLDHHDHRHGSSHQHDCHHQQHDQLDRHDHLHGASHQHDCHHQQHDQLDHHDHHHHHMDHNMYGLFLHVLADTLGSVGVVISTILIKYKGWLITDPACSILLSALIIASVIPLLKNSAEILLQRVPRHGEDQLKQALIKVSRIPGVGNLGRIHVWNFTNSEVVGSLHIQISDRTKKKWIRTQILEIMHDAGVKDVTLELEEV